MAIGVVISGIITGLFAVIGALTAGLPIWAAALLYPLMGTLGAVAFITVMSRTKILRLPRVIGHRHIVR